MAECIIPIKSATLAKKAQRALWNVGIRSEFVSVDPSVTRRGCSFGLSLACRDSTRGAEVLEKRNITHGDIIGGYGGDIS